MELLIILSPFRFFILILLVASPVRIWITSYLRKTPSSILILSLHKLHQFTLIALFLSQMSIWWIWSLIINFILIRLHMVVVVPIGYCIRCWAHGLLCESVVKSVDRMLFLPFFHCFMVWVVVVPWSNNNRLRWSESSSFIFTPCDSISSQNKSCN